MCAALANKQNLIAGGGDYIFDENAATAAANCNKANTSTKIRNPVLAPKWGPNGAARDLPDHYVIDCAGHNMTSLIPDIVDQAKSIFQQHGVVMLKNTGLATSNEMEVWMTKILTDKMKYEGGANSRRALKDSNVYDTGAPLSANLHYHHEMAYVPNSVASLGFCCVHCPENKGWTWISDQKQSTQYLLATKMGQKLKEKGLCYVRCLTNREAYQGVQKTWNGIDEIGVYNHWQQSFGVNTKEECEEKLQALGPQFKWTWGENDYLRTFFYVDTFEYFPGDDTNYLYASLADDAIWFDSWHGVNHLPTL